MERDLDYWKSSRIRWVVAVLALLVCGSIAFRSLFPKDEPRNFLNNPPQSWSYLRGYAAGIGWAVADIRHKRAYILLAGLSGGCLDRETGLTIWSVGCVVDKGIDGIVDGYNRIIRTYVRWEGPPEYSRKRWEQMLFNLNDYFDTRARQEPPQPLVVDGLPVLASDGKTKVWLRSRRKSQPDDIVYDLAWEPDVVCLSWPVWPKEGALQYFPGPPGSDLLLLRGRMGRTKDTEVTAVFDMRFFSYLRTEERKI